MIGVELAARHPTVPRALVLVDPGPIDPLPETVMGFEAFAEQLAGPMGQEVRRLYVQDMGARDEELARWIADVMCAVPLPIATAVIRGVNAWNGVGALALLRRPDPAASFTTGRESRRRPVDVRSSHVLEAAGLFVYDDAGHWRQACCRGDRSRPDGDTAVTDALL